MELFIIIIIISVVLVAQVIFDVICLEITNVIAMQVVVRLFHLGNTDKESVCTYSVKVQNFFFLNILNLYLVESQDVEPTDMEGIF